MRLATISTWAIHCSWASSVASTVAQPSPRAKARQSAIQSTCCSIDTTMLDSTDGLPGPVTMNRLGNPAAATPR